MKTLILTVEDISKLVKITGINNLMDEMIDRLHEGLLKFDETSSIIPPRNGFAYNRPDTGLLEWMPILKRGEMATFKIVGYHPTNPTKRKLPTIVSSISVFDTTNGHLIAVADAAFLTSLRTGAASAVASRIMGRPGSRVVGLIGCGAQAVTQLHALSRVFQIEEVLVHDIDPETALSFRKRTEFIGLNIQRAPLEELVARSDLISTATSVGKGEGPVFQDGNVKPWLHINAVGSDFPGKTEIPLSLLTRSFVFPDFLDQAVVEGECQQLDRNKIGRDLAHIVKHQQAYLGIQKNLSVFDSTGWALEDQLAMELLVERSRKLGLGNFIMIESSSDDPKNPYGFLKMHKGESTRTNDKRLLQDLLAN